MMERRPADYNWEFNELVGPIRLWGLAMLAIHAADIKIDGYIERWKSLSRPKKIGAIAVTALAPLSLLGYVSESNSRPYDASASVLVAQPGSGEQVTCDTATTLALENGLDPKDDTYCAQAGRGVDNVLEKQSDGTGTITVTIMWNNKDKHFTTSAAPVTEKR